MKYEMYKIKVNKNLLEENEDEFTYFGDIEND